MESVPERLCDLLRVLLEALAGPGDATANRRRLQDWLGAAGYDEGMIQDLLDWLEAHWRDPVRADWVDTVMTDEAAGTGVRHFCEQERQFLTPPAFGYLLDLCQAGQITRQQMEFLIQYASLVSIAPLERQDIEHLVDQVFFTSFGRATWPDPMERPGSAH
jgi:uncharacterized protein Smg (DUF494 family)